MEITFREYERLLRRLYWLNSEGKSDSPEADDLVEEMDTLWKHMSQSDRSLAHKLSKSLNLSSFTQ